jgi:beta-mannanase
MWIRPFGEMNGYWNPYSAFNADGSPRDADHSTEAFKKAFERIYLILHGGPDVNQKLAAIGQPPVSPTLDENPFITVIWNPQGQGAPDVAGNSPEAYFPGYAYADAIGDDIYDIDGKADWPDAEKLYSTYSQRPFTFPEWGLWGIDDPSFIADMAKFVQTHTRTVMLAYYAGSPTSPFDLGDKPRSRAAYRSLIVPLNK